MGGDQNKSGKHIYVYLAGLVLFVFYGCAIHERLRAHTYLSRAEISLEQGDYERAAQESQKLLDLVGMNPPGDKALFILGLTYAHYGSTCKDYKKSLTYFNKLISDYPMSPLTEESGIWVDVLQAIEETKRRRKFLDHAEELLNQQNYIEVIAESQKILDATQKNLPRAEALFALGLVYVHYGNTKRDYEKSFGYFKKLVSEYPTSSLVQRAKIWIGVIEVIEKMKQVDIDLEKKKKEWTKEDKDWNN
jgi:tetratricopeptide (TPR) repeat protein